MKLIELSKTGKKNKGKYCAMVDDWWYDYLNQWNWGVGIKDGTIYAVRWNSIAGCPKGTKREKIRMHRVVLGLTDPNLDGDHIDHNGINNQEYNLRVATEQENCFNISKIKNRSSIYKGVSFKKLVRHYKRKTDGRITTSKYSHYTSTIKKNGISTYIGTFHNEIDAAKAYDKKASELFGEFAMLNFPKPF